MIIDRSMIEMKCPKCSSEDIECYETDFNIPNGLHWDFYSCRDCDAHFDVKYAAVEIEMRD
jgi:hypothetical protein